jgi:CMP-N,N'-diacetyllegionaminic acid synthase
MQDDLECHDTDADYLAVVPFRAGSKGLEGKNFKSFCGRSLWSRAAAQGLRTCGNLICTTDAEISQEWEDFAGQILDHRPDHLSEDTSKMSDVIFHLIDRYNLTSQIIVLLQPTNPLRSDKDIYRALELYSRSQCKMVMSVSKKDNRILKHGFIKNGRFETINRAEYCFENRQNLPDVFGPNGAIYIFRADDFLAAKGFPHDSVYAYEMDLVSSIDIDKIEDFENAERVALASANETHEP